MVKVIHILTLKCLNICIFLSERQHHDLFPICIPSSDAILIVADCCLTLRNSSQDLVFYFDGWENLNLNFGRF